MHSAFVRFGPVVIALALVGPAAAQDEPAPQPAAGFAAEQLEQIVAPVALYPDTLLANVFMASTYPVEIVEADRWLANQGGITGTQLEDALRSQSWDPSVKALAMVPEVLSRMSANLDWARDLGDAFLGQQAELMDAVQRMRAKAKEAGNLESTNQQTVTTTADGIIEIDAVSEEVIYVPEYSTIVYGGGWYANSYYPHLYPPNWGLISFRTGVLVGAALWGDCHWGAGRGSCNVDVNRYNNFGSRTSSNFQHLDGNNRQNWAHDPQHRGGVNYRDAQVAQKYGAAAGANQVQSNRARGRTDAGHAQAGNRGGGGRDRAGADRPGAGGGENRPGVGGGERPVHHPSQGGFEGSSQPQTDRAASQRGNASRGGGGGARPGGGARGGGGRRGR
jgi:Protein of unknown function (DUF3300)